MTPCRRFITLLLAVLAALVLGVSTAALLSAIQEADAQVTLTSRPTASADVGAAVVPTQPPCAWMWARQDLPDVTALARQALAALPQDQLPARLGYFDARLTSDSGTERHFRAMFVQVRAALDEGLTGADWLAALAD